MRTISRAASHAADRAQRGGAIVVESEAIIGVVRVPGIILLLTGSMTRQRSSCARPRAREAHAATHRTR